MRRRPCFLVVDQEYPWTISSRKLIIEAAKFNVITAYDPEEAVESLERFPNLDGVVLNADMATGAECEKLLARLRAIVPNILIVITTTGGQPRCDHNEYYVDSLDPKQLLELLRSLKKDAATEIARRDSSS